MPMISPGRALTEMFANPEPLNPLIEKFVSSSGEPMCLGGNVDSSLRPTIIASSSSSVMSATRALPRTRPSLSTVTLSASSRTSARRWVM
ncbi:hypothetical protein KIV56_10070 [Cryobacterium breve]|uniref:Uncharacterized protein n=1 Tax=Cryobacterium breve TaxID=1259258 RepID=A0ABY7N8Y4_9MICO|nr:hypothetical protein [Cryobacterium breve]WBM78926.1 hypothetical protein KIV56_10070 [Cryobacterium breve]